jgi:hypothetical protein
LRFRWRLKANDFWEYILKDGVFRTLMVPVVFAMLGGFYLGSSACRWLLVQIGHSVTQANLLGYMLGGVLRGLVCASAVLYALRRWIEWTK